MQNNGIVQRVAEWLRGVPPFGELGEADLLAVASSVRVLYREAGRQVFGQSEMPDGVFYAVHKGAVHIVHTDAGNEHFVDACDEGDVFGLAALFTLSPYSVTARASEDTVLYAIRWDVFEPMLRRTPSAAMFFASGFAAGQPLLKSSIDQLRPLGDPELINDDALRIIPGGGIVSCDADTTIQKAALIMTQREVGSIVVVEGNGCPVGIVTDTDLRKKVITGEVGLLRPVSEVMSTPVKTIPPRVRVSEAIMAMMRHGIHHLCITEDGTPRSPAVGMISEHDVLVLHGNNPAILVKDILRTPSVDRLPSVLSRAQALLREFLEQEVAMPFVADAMTHIYDALVERALQHAVERMEAEGYGTAPAPWCWLALGSEGREEQMLRTDQDNALIFVAHSAEQARDYRPWFLRMASVAGEVLALCGFEPCPGGIMASNPEWCRSLGEWKDACRAWIQTPHPENILRSVIFFDLRPVAGDEALARELRSVIAEAADNELTMAFLAKHAVSTPPPLSFFRSFIVESDGEHRHEFDVKLRAITPIVDAARLLSLAAGAAAPVSTLGRLRHLREREPANAEVMSDAAAAFELLLRHRTVAGLKAGDSGRFIDIAGLSKMERQALRSSFRAIRALQEVVAVRFSAGALP